MWLVPARGSGRSSSLLEAAAPALVTPPPAGRRLAVRSAPEPSGESSDPVSGDSDGWWLLGAHGGAGVTSLRRCGVTGGDAERTWPTTGHVVVVARRTASGLEWARDAARQHAAGITPSEVTLAGLAVVADAPGRCPPRVGAFLDLVSAAFPHLWEVPWVEEWRLAGQGEVMPMPPAAKQLDVDLQTLHGACPHREEE